MIVRKELLWGIQCSVGTRSRHRRWRSQGFGDMSPTSVFTGMPDMADLRKQANLYKFALLASMFLQL